MVQPFQQQDGDQAVQIWMRRAFSLVPTNSSPSDLFESLEEQFDLPASL